MSAETRRRIREVAAKLGYEPNIVASHLRTQKNRTIGVIVIDNSNPFYAEVLKGIEDACRSRGYQILISNTQGDPAREEQAIRLMFSYRVRGMIIDPVPNSGDDRVRLLLKRQVAFVLASHYFSDLETNWVGYDDHMVGRVLGSVLLDKGHEKILFFGGFPGDSTYDDRFAGFQEALAHRGIECRGDCIADFHVDYDTAYRKMKLLLTGPRPFTAVLAYNDIAALAAMAAIKEEGLSVPGDVAVVGVDDIGMTGLVDPGLTTMHLPKEEAGRLASELLIDCIENGAPPRRVMLKPSLVMRGSV